MPLKTLLGTLPLFIIFLALLPEVSSNFYAIQYRRSLLLLRCFQRSRHVVVALLNTDPSRLWRIDPFKGTNFGVNTSPVEALLKNTGRKISVSCGTCFVSLCD